HPAHARHVQEEGAVIRLPALFLAVLVASLAPAVARPLTGAEDAALAAKVAAFDAAMREGDFAAIIEVIPPAMLDHIAREANVPSEDLIAALRAQMDEMFATVELVSFGMDLAAAEERELADGSPYVMIPTSTVMELEGMGRIKVD